MNIQLFNQFPFNQWQPFVIGVATSMIGAGIVALITVKILRIPSMELHSEYIPRLEMTQGIRLPVLNLSAVNKKRWVGFGSQDVHFGLFVPKEFFVADKQFMLITPGEGRLAWNNDLRGKNVFVLEGRKYYLFRQVIHLAVHPGSRTHFLEIRGEFTEIDSPLRIYYYFETPYGRVPSFLKFGERAGSFEKGKLPFVELNVK